MILWVIHKKGKIKAVWHRDNFGDLVSLYLSQWPYEIRKDLRATIEDDKGNLVVKTMNRYVRRCNP